MNTTSSLNSSIIIVLGFDFGEKNIGVATGNTISQTAQPLTILKANDGQPNWEEIEAILKDYTPQAFILGIPFTQDRRETEHIKRVRKFGKRLHGRFGLPLFEVDEFQTSKESQQYLKPSQKRKKGNLDALAAALIIERWFNQV